MTTEMRDTFRAAPSTAACGRVLMATMVPGYRHVPGNHCGSTALRNLLAFGGVELSEEMAFGLGAGACFYYIALDDQSPSRFTNGRTARLEEEFVELTGRGASAARRFEERERVVGAAARGLVDAGEPALLLTDLYYLDHYGNSAHFPGHAVVLAGYDDDVAYLSDTAFEELQTTTPREPRRRPPQRATRSTRSPGHMLSLPGRARAARAARGRPAGDRARRGADARARRSATTRACRRCGASPPRWGSGRRRIRRLAVVRALQLPGDRAPRHRRRQLPADVLAVPRRGRAATEARARGRGRRARGPRWPGRCSRRARPTSPSRRCGRAIARSRRGRARGRGAPVAGVALGLRDLELEPREVAEGGA